MLCYSVLRQTFGEGDKSSHNGAGQAWVRTACLTWTAAAQHTQQSCVRVALTPPRGYEASALVYGWSHMTWLCVCARVWPCPAVRVSLAARARAAHTLGRARQSKPRSLPSRAPSLTHIPAARETHLAGSLGGRWGWWWVSKYIAQLVRWWRW